MHRGRCDLESGLDLQGWPGRSQARTTDTNRSLDQAIILPGDQGRPCHRDSPRQRNFLSLGFLEWVAVSLTKEKEVSTDSLSAPREV